MVDKPHHRALDKTDDIHPPPPSNQGRPKTRSMCPKKGKLQTSMSWYRLRVENRLEVVEQNFFTTLEIPTSEKQFGDDSQGLVRSWRRPQSG